MVAPLIAGIGTSIGPLMLNAGLATAATFAAQQGVDLLGRTSNTPGHNALGIPNNPFRGNEKAGNPYWRPGGQGFAIDITGTDGKVRTEPVTAKNLSYTSFKNLAELQTAEQEERRKRLQGETEDKLIRMRDKEHGRGPSGAQQAQTKSTEKMHVQTLEAGKDNVREQNKTQITVTKLGEEGATGRTGMEVDAINKGTESKERIALGDQGLKKTELEILQENFNKQHGLNTRIQEAAERNTSYDQQMNSWRANAEIEAAQHAYRKNLPSGLATAAQGLALLIG